MNITVNGENYDQGKTHQFFLQGREDIKAHGIFDEHGYINKALYYTEMFTHLIGNLSAISSLCKEP